MNYMESALRSFQEIADNTPANSCSLLIHEGGALVDAGCACPGGWSVTKSVLEGLIGGRGQVGFAQRVVDGAQLPAVELFLDDPEGAAAAFAPDDAGLFGVKDGEDYVLGVCLSGQEAAQKARGNVVAAAPASLLASALQAAALLPQAVEALRTAGITDIQWGWSSCPIAPFSYDAAQAQTAREALQAAHGVVNLWVRGDKQAIQRVVNGFTQAKLHVHELATACTYLKQD